MKYLLLLLIVLASCSGLRKEAPYLAIHCGHLFDSEKGIWLKRQTLLIRDGVIEAINPSSLPERTVEIDHSREFIIPGLIDAHSHVFLEDPTYTGDFAKGLREFMANHSDEERKNLGEKRLQSLLKSGFTSVRDLGNQGGVQISGINSGGTRLFSSGPGFAPSEGQLPPGTPVELLRKEYLSLAGDPPRTFLYDLVKVYADEDPNPNIARVEDIRKWVNWARAKGLKVAAHAILSPGIEVAISGGVDTLEHGTFVSDEQLKFMKKKSIIFVPTYADFLFLKPALKIHSKSHTRNVTGRTCSNIRRARALGVELAFGSDNYFSLESKGVSFGEGTLEILLGYPDCGLTPDEVIRSATFIAAKTMGKENVTGVLKAGAFADFIVLKKNPSDSLEILRDPEAVYQNGIRQ